MNDDTIPAPLLGEGQQKSYETWLVYIPNGRAKPTIVVAMPWQTEREAWDAALFWPDDHEIEQERKAGAFSTRATVTYQDPRHGVV